MAVDEGESDINPPKTAANVPTPATPPLFLYPAPIPPSTPTSEIMSRHNRNFKVTTDSPGQLRVQRTRNIYGTPHPYPRMTHLAPAYEPGDDMPDAVDIAVATPSVAKEIRQAVASRTKTAGGRAKLRAEIERNPSKFYYYVGIHDILKRTINSVNYNAAGASGSEPARAKPKTPKPAKRKAPAGLQPESPELTNLLRDLPTVSQFGAEIIKSQYQTPSTSNAPADPRTRPENPQRASESHLINNFDLDRILASINGDIVMSSTEESTGSTKNETASEEFETISAPIEEHAE